MTTALVSLSNVSRVYNDGRVQALRGVTLEVPHGVSMAILGPSGSGKSTLLQLMGGLDAPSDGQVYFEGKIPASRKAWTHLRANRIGFVFQSYYLLPTLTAQENVEVPMFGLERRAASRQQKARALLDRMGLADRATHRPAELSGGERQRVAIARALANEPDLLLADEPTGNLDSHTSRAIMDLLIDIQARDGRTLVVVSHDPVVAARFPQQVHLRDGQIG